MAPAFGLVEAKGLLPYFVDTATKACGLRLYSLLKTDSGPRQMADKWINIIANGKSVDSATIDVNAWLGKATLDACVLASVSSLGGLWTDRDPASQRIGAGAFEYDFGALDETGNPFTESYMDIMCGQLPPLYPVQCSPRTNRLSYSLVLGPSGTLPNPSFSSWPSQSGSRD